MIPQKLHFITGLTADFGGKPFGCAHYLAIKSALLLNPGFQASIYYRYRPSGPYWDLLSPALTHVIVEPPTEVFGNTLYHFAHQADVLRLQILIEEGGVYMDIDTICQKPFSSVFGERVVMGVESTRQGMTQWDRNQAIGLCNAVVISPKGADFLRLWQASYRSFNAAEWNQHSVVVPAQLARAHPELIDIQPPETFFWPLHTEQGLSSLFVDNLEFPSAVSIHLWESRSWKYLSNLTLQDIIRRDTSYNRIARRFITDDVEQFAAVSATHGTSLALGTKTVFDDVYKNNVWGSGSGIGSSLRVAQPYVDFLENFIHLNDIKTVVDFGCGDWQFSQHVDWSGVRYLGIDIASAVVEANTAQFASEAIAFKIFDDFATLPDVDLILCKEVLQHVPNDYVTNYLKALRKKARLLIITNDVTPVDRINLDISAGGWRPLRLERAPFCLEGAYVFSYDSPAERLTKSCFLLVGQN